ISNKSRIKDRELWRNYGISLDTYYDMLAIQSGVCAICKFGPTTGDKRMCVDHIHVDGWEDMPPEERRLYVRGLLCERCNPGLGYFRDRIEFLKKSIEYLYGPLLGIQYKKNLTK